MTASASATLLVRLNTLRTAAGLKPLKSPKSIDAMKADIAKLAPKNTSDFADLCREYNVNPKVGRALYRRHVGMVSEFDASDAAQVARARELLAASAERIAA